MAARGCGEERMGSFYLLGTVSDLQDEKDYGDAAQPHVHI